LGVGEVLRLRGRLDGGVCLCLCIDGGRGIDALWSVVGGLAEGHRCCALSIYVKSFTVEVSGGSCEMYAAWYGDWREFGWS
jgi:hypothetical protein